MSETATVEPPPGIGDNMPPEGDALTMRLAEDYRDLPKRLDELLASLDRSPTIIVNDDQNKGMSDLKKEFRALRKKAETNREAEKEFFLSGGRCVDGWFKKWTDRAAEALADITTRKTTYEREKAAREERRRKEAERKAREEAERLAREAEKALAEAAAREAEAREAREKAERETAAALAKAKTEREAREAAELKALAEAAAREAEAKDATERAVVAELNRAAEQERLEKAAHARGIREAQERIDRDKVERAAKKAAEREAADLEAALAAQKAADIADADALKAKRLSGAKAADMSRSRSDYGAVSSLHTFWDHTPANPDCPDPVDRAMIDLEPLRQHLGMDALDKAVNAYVKAGGRKLRGVRIFENTVSRG